MVLDFLRRHKRVEVTGDGRKEGVGGGSYRRTSDPDLGEGEGRPVLQYTGDTPTFITLDDSYPTAWSPGPDPHSSLITLALDTPMTSDTVKRMRRQSSVQSLHKSGLTLLRQRKLFKSTYSVCSGSQTSTRLRTPLVTSLSQSTSCLVPESRGSAEELSDSGYSSWEAGVVESDSDSGVGTLTRAPDRQTDLVGAVLAAHPRLHPALRAVLLSHTWLEEESRGTGGDRASSDLVRRLDKRLRGRREELAASITQLREEKADLEQLAREVEGKLVSFRTVRRLLDFCSDLESLVSLGVRVEVRGEGAARLAEVRGWMDEREATLERAVEWELGQGWTETWRAYVRGKRRVVGRLAHLAEEARSLEAQLAVLATLAS